MIPFQRDLKRLADESGNASTPRSNMNSRRNNNPSARRRPDMSFRHRQASGLSISSKRTTMVQDYKVCGVYERNAMIEDVYITKVKNSVEFYFKKHILTAEQREIMLDTPTVLSKNGEKAHAANPYHADIGQMKLFFDGKTIHRCKVLDLFCESIAGKLQLRACIQLIDEAQDSVRVGYTSIFDYPQRIRFIREIEPESKKARLYLGYPDDFMDCEVEEFFAQRMEGRQQEQFHIKILDYKNDTYYVDIIGRCGRSIVSLMQEKFGRTKFKDCIDSSWPEPEATERKEEHLPFYPPTITMRRKPVNDTKVKNFNFRGGSLEYFKQMLKNIEASNPSASFIKKRFLRVLVIDWMDPDHLTIQPAEMEYYKNYAKFIQAIQNMDCVKNADDEYHRKTEPYQPGEHILFKNISLDPELGKWLRGVVVSASCFNENNLVVAHTKTDSAKQSSNVGSLMSNGILEPEDFVYLVRSTDFGYHFRTSHSSMRHLIDIKEFKTIGTWGLRCRLFGVNHALVESHKKLVVQKYSATCRGMMDSWIRERILDTTSHYYVLFRTNIWRTPSNSYDCHFDITLYHRFEPLEDFIILNGPRKTRFDCLNWFLVERGAAGDEDKENPGVSTNIQLDSYIVNKLVEHDMI